MKTVKRLTKEQKNQYHISKSAELVLIKTDISQTHEDLSGLLKNLNKVIIYVTQMSLKMYKKLLRVVQFRLI